MLERELLLKRFHRVFFLVRILDFCFRLFFGLLLCAEKQLFLGRIGDAGHKTFGEFYIRLSHVTRV